MSKKYRYLTQINTPKDIQTFPSALMNELCAEIRDFLCENVQKTGGHLASNLGVVELTCALHKVFDSTKDHIIFDVGHQSYVHKILTGRKDDFATLRQPGGLSGFTKRSESVCDPFGAGHSSTSLSAAIGFAESDKILGKDAYTIAVIGDGSYTGGMVHEALNNCKKGMRLIIILNENEMSISKNIGGFAKQIAKIRSSQKYYRVKDKTKSALEKIPLVGQKASDIFRDTKQAFKNIMYDSNYFEQLGIYYMGPVDGNDYDAIKDILRVAKEYKQSCVIHVKTKKGKGYLPAENNPELYHSVPSSSAKLRANNFSHVMGKHLTNMAYEHDDICAITAAMSDGTGLDCFRSTHADRFFDVGIAEEHAATFSAGLCANGMKPFFAVYSSFLQRAYDNLIHDVSLQNLPITLCIDRAGLSCGDGPTHHGIFDIAFLSHLPNMTLYSPVTNKGICRTLELCYKSKTPSAIRYPNDEESLEYFSLFHSNKPNNCVYFDYDKQDDFDLIIIAFGNIYKKAVDAKNILSTQGKKVGVMLVTQILPFSKVSHAISISLPNHFDKVMFVEEGIYSGGASLNISQNLLEMGLLKPNSFKIQAITNPFEYGKQGVDLYDSYGLSAKKIVNAYKKMIEND